MLIKLTGFAVFSLLLFMMTPAFANVTSLDLEKSVYFDNEFIKFVGTQDEKDVVYIIIRDALGDFKEILSDLNPNQGEFLVSSSLTFNKVSDIFDIDGIYNVTAYTNEQKENNGIILRLEYKNNKVSVIEDVLLALKSIPDYSVEVEKTITFTASLEDSSVGDAVFSLDKAPLDATIDPSSGQFVWAVSKSYGNIQDQPYTFDIVVNIGAQEDRENITITVKKAYDEPETTEPEPETTTETTEPELKELEIPAPFVDETKEPQSYVDRYNNEASYKKWFDDNYPEYSSIYEAVGLEEPIIEEPEFGECGEGTKLIDGKCTIVAIQSKGGGCLIATAAYGSEMAPQVQLLREIRDNQLMNTDSGISFMTGFNQFYYSFSPTIADMQRENPIFKEAVKLWITPLLSSLSVMSYAESESQVIGYGIGVILMNIGMYFVAPVMLFYGIRKVRRAKF
ncbi:MAG: hypothetical protein IIB80_05140 [Thaumarchaeota archaeon]|nr:hypothetical protein [Nitrososphaerota archaeon]